MKPPDRCGGIIIFKILSGRYIDVFHDFNILSVQVVTYSCVYKYTKCVYFNKVTGRVMKVPVPHVRDREGRKMKIDQEIKNEK